MINTCPAFTNDFFMISLKIKALFSVYPGILQEAYNTDVNKALCITTPKPNACGSVIYESQFL